jgi:hypothetical protein
VGRAKHRPCWRTEDFKGFGCIARRDDETCWWHFEEEQRRETAESRKKPTGANMVGALAYLALALSACGARPTPWRGATPATWPALREALAEVRAGRNGPPWTAAARVTLRDAATGRTIVGRGGLAVAPGRALRMILVGVAGATMLDAWVTPQRWRVAVPALGLVRRGGGQAPADLPVRFLRWWFFTPLDGRLFAATYDDSGRRTWLLRSGAAVIELRVGACDRGQRLTASRREEGRTESVEECRAADRPTKGDHVHYQQDAAGLSVDLDFDAVSAEPPVAEAFADPDAAESTR